MDYLQDHPNEAKWTFGYMAAAKAAMPTWMNGEVSVDDFKLSEADITQDRVMVVDVGGGSGHQMLDLRKRRPELKGWMTVQDVPVMIGQVDTAGAEAIGLEAMAHDFFTPQPVKGAKVYYLRLVLHDWPDAECQIILKQLREAMESDSVIVVDEQVVPAKGASKAQIDFDLTMLAAVGAMERNERQWADLFSSAELRLRNVWVYDEHLHSAIIVCVPT